MVFTWLCNWRLWNNFVFPTNRNSISCFELMIFFLINGLITSIALETIILLNQKFGFVALIFGMSLYQ